jgi:hypothetical protein
VARGTAFSDAEEAEGRKVVLLGSSTAEGQPAEAGAVDLDQDPFDDDLTEQLSQRAPRPRATRATLVLAGLLLVVVGFVGGSLAQNSLAQNSLAQKQWGTRTAANPLAGLASARAGGGAFPGGLSASGTAGGGSGAAAAPITGTVTLVDGTTIYIVTSDGRVVTVKTGDTTTVELTQPGKISDLKAGNTITVTGRTGTDGMVSATTVTRAK